MTAPRDRTPVRLDGHAVVVTGAGQGLGAAYARLIGRLGASVLVNDLAEESADATAESIRSGGGDAQVFVGSVSDPSTAEALVAACVESFGSITGLVNNAGAFGCARIEEDHGDLIERLLAVNVAGTAHVGLAALRHMRAKGRGSVVNITSGTQSGTPGLGIYAATKGAISSLTYSWAMECAGTGVRVNAVSPNAHTSMAEAYEAWRGDAGTGQNLAKSADSNAPLIAYLLSDASADVNGQVLRIDGSEISLVTHPALRPSVRDDEWTVDRIAAAVEAGRLGPWEPLGVVAAQGS
ncbi:MAG: SDR family oxidoreductase [Tetrasphaera sp.]|nr:SDR family oxidoreductase [Tetrasphaera sp.]